MPEQTWASPISNYKSRLMISDDGQTYSMLCPIKGTPKIGGEPNLLDVSTNEDAEQKNIFGMKKSESTSVKANWDPAVFESIRAMEKQTKKLALYLGNDGEGGSAKIKFDGQLAIALTETDVDAPLEMEIYITVTANLEVVTGA